MSQIGRTDRASGSPGGSTIADVSANDAIVETKPLPVFYYLEKALSLASPAPLEQRAVDPTVTIASGVVVGTATRLANQPTVTGLANSYLGIPKWCRWRERSSIIQQRRPAPSARERGLFVLERVCPEKCESIEPETCNVLDLWRKLLCQRVMKAACDCTDSIKGNLNLGTGSLAIYNGSSLAVNEDVVVVTFNYRTNSEHFPSCVNLSYNVRSSV
nr:hypothetical protein CFP56_30091 [Quercus suber]